MKDFFTIDVTGCSRCGENHEEINFYEFISIPERYTHWGMCPINEEPILLLIQGTNITEEN